MPDNRQSLHQAIHSYTADGAFAGFMEGKTGVLRQGMLADICVLPVNLQRMDPSSFKGIKPRMTVCDGRVVFGVEATGALPFPFRSPTSPLPAGWMTAAATPERVRGRKVRAPWKHGAG